MKIFSILIVSLALAGCSVGMAARTGGVKTEDVVACETRDCFLSQDKVEVLNSTTSEAGQLTEAYKFQLKRGSVGRAAMHGLLDVATLGIWEVAGTPIEATKKKKYVIITATYDDNGRVLTKQLGNSLLANPGEPFEVPDDAKPVTSKGEVVGYLLPDGQIIPLGDVLEKADEKETEVTAGS